MPKHQKRTEQELKEMKKQINMDFNIKNNYVKCL